MLAFGIGMLVIGAMSVALFRQSADAAARVFRGGAWKGVERTAEQWRPTMIGIGVLFLLGGAALLVVALVERGVS
jgi:uncharacterized iron-regulated membrane protein